MRTWFNIHSPQCSLSHLPRSRGGLRSRRLNRKKPRWLKILKVNRSGRGNATWDMSHIVTNSHYGVWVRWRMLQLFIFPGSQHLHLVPSSPLSKFAQNGLGCSYWFSSSLFDEAQHKAENPVGTKRNKHTETITNRYACPTHRTNSCTCYLEWRQILTRGSW